MKIALINISDKIGGAAIAGYRIAKALKKHYQMVFFFIVRTKSSMDVNVFTTTPNPFLSKLERYFNIAMNTLGLQYIYLPFSPWFILKKIKEEKPDIIHLHNPVGGYFMLGHLEKLSSMAPIIWTLHDMWAFTASAAHTFGDESWKYMRSAKNETHTYPHIGLNTGRWLIRRKKEIYQKSNITFVVPSRWLYDLAKQSPLLEGKEIHYIPHGIDLTKFSPKEKHTLKIKFGLPENGKVLVFSAQNIKKNSFKGGTDLSIILKKINELTKSEIHVLLMGQDKNNELMNFENIKIHSLGYVKEEEKIIEVLNAADVFLYPTRADNLPLVLMESIACGTPCITFDVGGCGDIIKDGYNGHLIKPSYLDEAAEKTVALLNNNNQLVEFSKNARKYAEERFSEEKMASEYYHLFNKTLKKNTLGGKPI